MVEDYYGVSQQDPGEKEFLDTDTYNLVRRAKEQERLIEEKRKEQLKQWFDEDL